MDEIVIRRRTKILMVNPADFMAMFTKGLWSRQPFQVIEGVPNDAKIIAITYDHLRHGIMFVVESGSYDEIPLTEVPPIQLVSINIGEPYDKVRQAKKRH